MKKILLATIGCCLMSGTEVHSQNWLPAVTFPANKNVCDPTSWKLVLYDDFDGTTLKPTWQTFVSWDGMQRVVNGVTQFGDHEYWEKGRISDGKTAIKKSTNVIVSNGTCKLLLKIDPNISWTYPGGAVTNANLSNAIISTPYHTQSTISNDVNKNFFNAGTRFEARIKYPLLNDSWCAFWIWHGAGVNEIDMSEEYGGKGGNSFPYLGDRRRVLFNCGAWYPRSSGDVVSTDPIQNPYNINQDNGFSSRYPGQSWTNFMAENNFKQENWHTYTYDWDTAVVKAYLDGSLVGVIWKYFQSFTFKSYVINMGSQCTPPAGTWKVIWGFPYKNKSECNLRLETKFGDNFEMPNPMPQSPVLLDQMEIDYVKVWQRHPEEDGHGDLCAYAGTIPSLSSNKVFVCSNGTTFTVNPATPNGWWDFSNTLSVMGSSSNSITLYNNTYTSYANGYVRYHYADDVPGCPERYVERRVMCNENPHNNPHPGNLILVKTNSDNGDNRFQLSEGTEYATLEDGTSTTPSFEWDLDLIDPVNKSDSIHYKAYGQFISIPYEIQNEEQYILKWKLKVTDVDNNIAYKEGTRTNLSRLLQQPEDPTVYYFDANITDPDGYNDIVHTRVEQTMVSEAQAQDTMFLLNMIEKLKVDELEPYLIFDNNMFISINNNKDFLIDKVKSRIYPNPAADKLYIEPGVSFIKNSSINVEIFDAIGKCVFKHSIINDAGIRVPVDINGLADGHYLIMLKQGKLAEAHKLVKKK